MKNLLASYTAAFFIALLFTAIVPSAATSTTGPFTEASRLDPAMVFQPESARVQYSEYDRASHAYSRKDLLYTYDGKMHRPRSGLDSSTALLILGAGLLTVALISRVFKPDHNDKPRPKACKLRIVKD